MQLSDSKHCVFQDDDDEDEVKVVDISVESMIAAAREADETGTVAKQDRSKENEEPKKVQLTCIYSTPSKCATFVLMIISL